MTTRDKLENDKTGKEIDKMPQKARGCPLVIRKIIESEDAAKAYVDLQESE